MSCENQFDSFCKKILKNHARNYEKQLCRYRSRECFSEDVCKDSSFWQAFSVPPQDSMYTFRVMDINVVVENFLLGAALEELEDERRDIVLLFPLRLPEELERIHFNLRDLKTKYCDAGQTTVLPANVNTESLFLVLGKIPNIYKLSYFKIKFQELLLLLYIQNWSKSKGREAYSAMTINAIKAIHERLLSDLKKRPTIEALSKEFLLNTSTLKKAFKAVYGQPIAQYMKKYRMQFAASLLCQTSMQVGEISEAVGYESQSKFASGFKEIMQISPVEYRNRYRMKKKEYK